MVLRRVGTPKKIVSETEPAYEERAVWIEVDSSGNIIKQYVGFFDEWILIDTNANFPVHFDFLQPSQPALDAGKSWLEVTSFVTNTIDTPTTGSNIYEFDISSTDDVFNVNSVTVLGNSSSDSRGPVTITDSGSATVDPQGTRVEDATVTFTGIKSTQSRSYSGTSAESESISRTGNLPTDATFSVELEDDVYTRQKVVDTNVSNTETYTIPQDAPSGKTYQISAETKATGSPSSNDSTLYEHVLYKNGNEIARDYTSIFGTFDRTFTLSTNRSLSPGDEVKIDIGKAGSIGAAISAYRQQITVTQTSPGEGNTTIEAGNNSSVVSNGGTTTLNLESDVNSISVTHSGPQDISSWSLNYDDISQTKNPSLTVDGETVSHTGALTDGEIATKNLTSLTPGSYTANVSVSGPLSTAIEWTDITETVDPTISLNGNTAGYNGVLTSGDSVNLDIEKSWLISGTNTLEIINGSPASLILEYDEVDTSGQTTVRLYFSDGNNWYEL